MKVTDVLLGEHGVLRELLDYLERLGRSASNPDSIGPGLTPVVDVLLSHARLEDELLFAALESQLGGAAGPLAVMRLEHDQLEQAINRLQEGPRLPEAAGTIAEVVQLARDHFIKEEQVLFPMADQVLAPDVLGRLGVQWIELRWRRSPAPAVGPQVPRHAQSMTAERSCEEGGPTAEGEREQGRFILSKDTVVAEVLERIPGALELLISYGLTPLADPALRDSVTPHVTLETASRVHAFELDALLQDLNRLALGELPQTTSQVDAAGVLVALRQCYDPELPANIVDLGLVYDIEIEGARVVMTMTLTSPDHRMASQVVARVTDAVRALGASEVEVKLVREPPWTPSRVTPAARAALGWE